MKHPFHLAPQPAKTEQRVSFKGMKHSASMPCNTTAPPAQIFPGNPHYESTAVLCRDNNYPLLPRYVWQPIGSDAIWMHLWVLKLILCATKESALLSWCKNFILKTEKEHSWLATLPPPSDP